MGMKPRKRPISVRTNGVPELAFCPVPHEGKFAIGSVGRGYKDWGVMKNWGVFETLDDAANEASYQNNRIDVTDHKAALAADQLLWDWYDARHNIDDRVKTMREGPTRTKLLANGADLDIRIDGFIECIHALKVRANK